MKATPLKKIILLLYFFPFFVNAQKNAIQISNLKNTLDQINFKPNSAKFNSDKIFFTDGDRDKIVHDYFKNKLIEIQKPTDDLKTLQTNTSPMGYHYHYQQTYHNIPIFGATFDATISVNGLVISSFNNLINSTTFSDNNFVSDASNGDAIFIFTDNSLVPAYKKYVGYFEVINDANGNLIRQRDSRFGFNNDDTLVSGKAFLPDPLTSQGVIYGQNGTYQHFNDSDYALLNDQRKPVTFQATFFNDTFYLQNKYVQIIDIAAPHTPQVKSKLPMFDFTRKQDEFKDLNVFYHLYDNQMYYQSLGFFNLANYQIKVDAQEDVLGDNSNFNPSDTTLNFGTGGIPDAEDGDIPNHEYTHVLSFFINATPNMSNERRSIEEAICDVIAEIRSKKYNQFNWRKFSNFDCPNPIEPGLFGFWSIRGGDSPKTYLDKTGSWYPDSEIWSSTILDISDQIGVDEAAKLMLTTIYSMPYNVTMPQAATLFLQADSMLYAKAYDWKIYPIFNARKLGSFPTGINDITNSSTFKILNTAGFASGSGDAVIETTLPSTILVYNISGQKIIEAKNTTDKIILQTSQFQKGFYFITIENSNGIFTSKIIKF